jgi:hypothetical protein
MSSISAALAACAEAKGRDKAGQIMVVSRLLRTSILIVKCAFVCVCRRKLSVPCAIKTISRADGEADIRRSRFADMIEMSAFAF